MRNAVKSKTPTSKVCVTCGVTGYPHLLATCHRCRRSSEHIYCMSVSQPQIPDSWHCERCEHNVQNIYIKQKSVKLYNNSVAGEKKVHRTHGSLSPSDAAYKNHNSIKDGRGMIKGFRYDKSVMQSSLQNPSPKVAENAKVKYITPEEVALAHPRAYRGQRSLGSSRYPNDHSKVSSLHISKRPVGNIFKSHVSNELPNAEIDGSLSKFNEKREIVTSYKGTKAKLEKRVGCPSSNCGRLNVSNYDSPPLDIGDVSTGKGLTCSDVQSKGCSLQDTSLPRKLITNTAESPLNCPSLGACWKVTFEVSDGSCQKNTGIQAHYPLEISEKAYEILKIFPVNLKLKIVPRMDVWPKLFQSATPNHEDIGLFFLPDECERSKEKYTCLLSLIEAHDSAMQTTIGDAELLIYSSTHLTADSQRIDKKTYLWGVFQHTKKRKRDMHCSLVVAAGMKVNYSAQFADTLEGQDEVDMEIDMIGGINVGPIDIVLPNPNAPPGFQRQI